MKQTMILLAKAPISTKIIAFVAVTLWVGSLVAVVSHFV